MRTFVAPVVWAFTLAATAAVAGCQAHGEIRAGGAQEAKAPPPAPPPPPAQTAAPPPAEPEKRPMKMSFTVKDGKIELPGPVVFKTGEATLEPQSDPVLQIVHDYLAEKKEISKLRIEGHTDNVGDPSKNMQLSIDRAAAVARWLVAKGTECKRLIPVGFGDTKPVAPNDTPEGRSQNRRTDFRNAELNGKPIMGLPVDGGGKPAPDACAK